MSVDQATYTFVDDLAKSVPELQHLLTTASAAKWDAQRFADAVQATGWWRKNSDTAKQMIQLQAVDPAQYTQTVTNAQAHVRQVAASLGVNLTDAQVKSQATADLYQGLDDATLQQQLGILYKGPAAGGAGGHSVTLDQQIGQMAASYGVPVTQSWIDGEVRGALSTGNGIEGAQKQIMQMAKSTYPGLAQQIDAGMTTAQVAQPYIAQMAQTLEIPDTQIQLTDRTIQQALQGTQLPPAGGAGGAGGGAAPQPVLLSDFQKQLKNDPRWGKTDNARDTAYGLLHSLGQSWGFSS